MSAETVGNCDYQWARKWKHKSLWRLGLGGTQSPLANDEAVLVMVADESGMAQCGDPAVGHRTGHELSVHQLGSGVIGAMITVSLRRSGGNDETRIQGGVNGVLRLDDDPQDTSGCVG